MKSSSCGEKVSRFRNSAFSRLSRSRTTTGNTSVMLGVLLKIGAQQDVFPARVHMIRDGKAFDKCAIAAARVRGQAYLAAQ